MTLYTSLDESTATPTGPPVSTISTTEPKIYAVAVFAIWHGTHTDVFHLISQRVEPSGTKPDFQQVRSPLERVTPGEVMENQPMLDLL